MGSYVFSSTGTTAYARVYAPPVFRRTPGQSDNRAKVSENGIDWATLDGTEKAAWNTWAADPGEIDYDPWGVQRFLSGWQWFARSTMRLKQVGLTMSVAPPTKPIPAPLTGIVLHYYEAGATSSSIAYDGGQFGTDEALIVMAGTRKSHNLSENVNGIRAIALVANPGNTGEDLGATVAQYFGDLQVGWDVVSYVFHQDAQGQRGVAQTFINEVEAQP